MSVRRTPNTVLTVPNWMILRAIYTFSYTCIIVSIYRALLAFKRIWIPCFWSITSNTFFIDSIQKCSWRTNTDKPCKIINKSILAFFTFHISWVPVINTSDTCSICGYVWFVSRANTHSFWYIVDFTCGTWYTLSGNFIIVSILWAILTVFAVPDWCLDWTWSAFWTVPEWSLALTCDTLLGYIVVVWWVWTRLAGKACKIPKLRRIALFTFFPIVIWIIIGTWANFAHLIYNILMRNRIHA